MARQVYFYMHPDDLREMEADLRNKWGLVFFPCSLPGPEIALLADLTADGVDSARLDRLTVLACLPDDLRSIAAYERPLLSDWTVDLRTCPAVELWRSYFDGTILKRGRFYYHPEGQPQAFLEAASGVLRHLRRTYTKEGGCYVGPAANRWRTETNGSFKQL